MKKFFELNLIRSRKKTLILISSKQIIINTFVTEKNVCQLQKCQIFFTTT